MPAEEPPEPDQTAAHMNWFTDGEAGNVVQASYVHGGVHFHDARESFEVIPRQLPGHA